MVEVEIHESFAKSPLKEQKVRVRDLFRGSTSDCSNCWFSLAHGEREAPAKEMSFEFLSPSFVAQMISFFGEKILAFELKEEH